jgi:hypothetical protein
MIKVGEKYRDEDMSVIQLIAETDEGEYVGRNNLTGDYSGYTSLGKCNTGGKNLLFNYVCLHIHSGEFWLDHFNNKVFIAGVNPSEFVTHPILGVIYPNTIGQRVVYYSRDGKSSDRNNYPLKEKIQ